MDAHFKHSRLVISYCAVAAIICVSLCAGASAQKQKSPARARLTETQRIAQEVNHELLSLPTLSVFDNLKFDVKGTTVILAGQVTQPATKHDAEENVKHIEGISQLTNNIEVLPLSPMDDQLRRALYRAIYGDPALERYAIGALQPIHIIVKGGHVTLEGVVDNAMDKQIAQTRALSVPTAFSVDNHLQVLHRA